MVVVMSLFASRLGRWWKVLAGEGGRLYVLKGHSLFILSLKSLRQVLLCQTDLTVLGLGGRGGGSVGFAL